MMQEFIRRWQACQRGATAIEYTLIAAGIAITILATLFLIGDDLSDFYFNLGDNLNM